MTAAEARKLSEKAHNDKLQFDGMIEQIREHAKRSQTSLITYDTPVTVLQKLETLGYKIEGKPHPDDGTPCVEISLSLIHI